MSKIHKVINNSNGTFCAKTLQCKYKKKIKKIFAFKKQLALIT